MAWASTCRRRKPLERQRCGVGQRAFFHRAGTPGFACASWLGVPGKHIRWQDLPELSKNPGFGSEVAIAPATCMGGDARGIESIAPGIKRRGGRQWTTPYA